MSILEKAVHAKAVRHVGQSDSEELLADVQTYHRQSQCQTPSLQLTFNFVSKLFTLAICPNWEC